MKTILKTILLTMVVVISTIPLYAADNAGSSVKLKLVQGVWDMWDDCDSRQWNGESWGAGISTWSWVTFDGRKCLKFVVNAHATEAWAAITGFKYFSPENWESPITSFTAVTYVDGTSQGDLKLEVYNSASVQAGNDIVNNVSEDAWTSVKWNMVDISTHVARLYFVIDGLPTPRTYNTTYYIDALVLGTQQWDDMGDPSHKWVYANDAAGWSNYEAISHNHTSNTTPAGALFMRWDSAYSGGTVAEVKAENLNDNWSEYLQIKADVYCSSTSNDIDIVFFDGVDWPATTAKRVSAANQWETITWNLPATTFNKASVRIVDFRVITNSGNSTGTIYIDNIQLLK